MNERVGIIVPTNRLLHGLAKGLPFDSVLLPRLTERSFPWVRGVARQRILFVGIARATQWVYLSTVNNYEISEMEILRRAEAEGHLVIQERDDFRAREEEPEEDDFSVL